MDIPDTPCTPADRAAIIAAAHERGGRLRWLAACLGSQRWGAMSWRGRDDIRARVVAELLQLAEGAQP